MAGSQGVGGFTGHLEEIPVLPPGKGVSAAGLGFRRATAAGGEIPPVDVRSLSH